MNTHHSPTSPSRIERLLAYLAGHRDFSSPSSARVDLIHDLHVVPIPSDR